MSELQSHREILRDIQEGMVEQRVMMARIETKQDFANGRTNKNEKDIEKIKNKQNGFIAGIIAAFGTAAGSYFR